MSAPGRAGTTEDWLIWLEAISAAAESKEQLHSLVDEAMHWRRYLGGRSDVVKVVDLTEGNHIERELMLVKVRAAGKDREEIKRTADIFRGRIIDVTDKSYTIELTGTTEKLDAFLEALDRSAILETVRTGVSGIGRGEWVLKV